MICESQELNIDELNMDEIFVFELRYILERFKDTMGENM